MIARPPVVANSRMSSQSAPARGTRMPTTQTGGTVTRRTNAPTRRPQPGMNSVGVTAAVSEPRTAPPIVVSGVGGLKALRGARANK
jgi:hypothetical protein